MQEVTFLLNNEPRTVGVEPNETLLEMLRDRLAIKSPKCGCDRGDCGACAVMLNGKSVRSCLVLALEVEGMEILTLEGISRGELSRLQKAFIDFNSFQCGYCAPGVIITVTELLSRNPHPCLEEIKESLSGNLCRCTGYKSIFDAILDLTAGEER